MQWLIVGIVLGVVVLCMYSVSILSAAYAIPAVVVLALIVFILHKKYKFFHTLFRVPLPRRVTLAETTPYAIFRHLLHHSFPELEAFNLRGRRRRGPTRSCAMVLAMYIQSRSTRRSRVMASVTRCINSRGVPALHRPSPWS